MTNTYSILASLLRNTKNTINMKPVDAHILENIGEEHLFSVKEINLPYFSTEFHFHKECQLVYVVESKGRRIIGDSIEHFENDEMIFLGSGIPHVWHNDQQYFDKRKKLKARSIALFFNSEILLDHLHDYATTKKMSIFLQKASKGMKFHGTSKALLKELLLEACRLKGLKAMINFLTILDVMSSSAQFDLLASEGYINNYQNRDNDRMDRVFKYVFDNFGKEVSLTVAADIACMNVQAFCRYFKSRTQKPFIQFVNEIRIGHACKLLNDKQSIITSVAFNCGYNSISHFNRFFKDIKGVTPREYKKCLNE